MKYGTDRGFSSDDAQLGGSDYVQCYSLVFLTTSSVFTLVAISLLMFLQFQRYGCSPLIFTVKSLVFVTIWAFNVVNLIDLLRYPLKGYIGTQSLFSLEYGFKYASIVIICWYFIRQSSMLVKKSEQEKFRKWWTTLIVTAIVVFIVFISVESYEFASELSSIDPDEKLDAEFHDCKEVVTVLFAMNWVITNIWLSIIGRRIQRATLNANLHIIALEQDSFHRTGIKNCKLVAIRKRQSEKMTQVLCLMLCVSSYSLINTIYKFFFFSSDCNPVYEPHWLASFFEAIDIFVTRQIWVYVVCAFFWPTKRNIELDQTHDDQAGNFADDTLDDIDFNITRRTNADRSHFGSSDQSGSIGNSVFTPPSRNKTKRAISQSSNDDSDIAFLGVTKSLDNQEMQENWLAKLKQEYNNKAVGQSQDMSAASMSNFMNQSQDSDALYKSKTISQASMLKSKEETSILQIDELGLLEEDDSLVLEGNKHLSLQIKEVLK